jgi:hypothetical protein
MKKQIERHPIRRFGAFGCIILALAGSLTTLRAQAVDWSGVENVLGRKGTVQGAVTKITFPRSDLHVKAGNVSLDPALALTSWLAFSPMGESAMVMGDLVLLESEIAPVEKSLLENGLKISAIHNHILGEEPKIMYMHVGGVGDAVKLAEGMKAVFAQTGTPVAQTTPAASPSAPDWSDVEKAMGRAGKHNGNVIQFGVPRAEKISEQGMEIPPFMGMATVINMQKIDEKNAATTGDFVLLAAEVEPVTHALIGSGFTVTAIHSHMLFESPRLIFLHFWRVGPAIELAQGLKNALEKTNSIR